MVALASDSELEVKFYVSDLAEMEARLVQAGATLLQPRSHEFNLRFDTPSGDLHRAQSILRLRRDKGSHVTFKGPSTTLGGVLARQEIEFDVNNFSAAQKLIEALGYRANFVYEKHRTTYALDGLKITLDEMPYGNFIEIEGKNAKSIRDAAERFRLDWDLRLPETYISIFRRMRELFGWQFADLTFENFENKQVNMDRVGIRFADRLGETK
jgi:adenylate cyclase, class 2